MKELHTYWHDHKLCIFGYSEVKKGAFRIHYMPKHRTLSIEYLFNLNSVSFFLLDYGAMK